MSDTKVIITGLTNGVEYTISVTADNDQGSSAPAVAEVTPNDETTRTSTVPRVPGDVWVEEGDGELTVFGRGLGSNPARNGRLCDGHWVDHRLVGQTPPSGESVTRTVCLHFQGSSHWLREKGR